MTVTINGRVQNRQGMFRSSEDLDNTTSTGVVTVSLTADVSTIAGGTATGFGVNRFLLGTATTYGTATDADPINAEEGQEKTIVMLATGEAQVIFTGTATGSMIMTAAEDILRLKFVNEVWADMGGGGATLATATGTA